jgi:alpha-1,3-fucosyltransferase
MMERPQLRLFFGFSVFAWVTLFLTYLDYRYTLIPKFSYHQGKVSVELFIRKFGHVYPNSTRKTKQILLWTGFFDSPKMWDSLMNNTLQRCSFSCVATTNRQYLHLSDAIMFHEADIDFQDLPGLRVHRQPWVLFTLEPTTLVKKNYKWFNQVFNWTMSYRNHSTVLGKYGTYGLKRDKEKVEPVSLQNKNKTMFAAISNCHDAGRRFKLIKKISEYIDVDQYGRCSPKKCVYFNGPCLTKEKLVLYKFKLALENSHCRKYVTGKYWQTLEMSANYIPIVNWIDGQKHPNVIPNSYIIFYDFKNIEEFINHIRKVSSNETLFKQYFEWRNKFSLVASDMYCKLCEKLHKPYQAQVYDDLGGWLNEDICTKYSVSNKSISYCMVEIK